MNISDIFTAGISKVIDSAGNAIDRIVTSDEERGILKNELIKIQAETELTSLKLENEYQKEITKRWESDNKSGVLSKNVRPAVLIYLLIILSAMAFSSGNIGEFTIDDAFIELFKLLAITAFGAYFGGKSYEKGKGK